MADSPRSLTQSSATDSIAKHEKLSKEEAESNNTIDSISSLPDSLLCHILSFLPTKHAVATSILSTRWKYLWTLVTTLDFDDAAVINPAMADEDRARYMNFVHTVLAPRDNGSCIKKFRFKSAFKGLRLNELVCAAITRGVEELDLQIPFYSQQPVELPHTLFTCKTLVVLKLTVRTVLNVPSSVYFPRLKILHLHSVRYGNDESARKLLSGCPILEDLSIVGSYCDTVRMFNISAPALKKLKIHWVILTLDWAILYPTHISYKFVINAPALEYLSLKGLVEASLIENPSSLIEAEVDVIVYEHTERFGNRVMELLRGFYNVNLLSLSHRTMETLQYASSYDLPMYHNLTELKIGIGCCDWLVLPNFLESSPNLEVLSLTEDFFWASRHSCWSQLPRLVAKSRFLCLTKIDISELKGLKGVLKLVRSVLKNAKVSKKVKINVSTGIYNMECLRFTLSG